MRHGRTALSDNHLSQSPEKFIMEKPKSGNSPNLERQFPL